MLDPNDTISRLQSGSVRNAIVLIVVNVLVLVSAIAGKVFDVDAIKEAMEFWLPQVINALTVYWGWRAYKGRVEAQKQIEPLPWKDEIKTLVKKD